MLAVDWKSVQRTMESNLKRYLYRTNKKSFTNLEYMLLFILIIEFLKFGKKHTKIVFNY